MSALVYWAELREPSLAAGPAEGRICATVILGGLIETISSILLLIGLFSRPAAFIMSGEMAIAYWYAHFPRNPFPYNNGGTLAVLYCFVFLYIFFAGPGPWSADAARATKSRSP